MTENDLRTRDILAKLFIYTGNLKTGALKTRQERL